MTRVAVIVVLLASAACASAPRGSARRCSLEPGDSSFAAGQPLYRDCAVDRPARQLNPGVRIDVSPQLHASCYTTQLRFVVDATGAIELGTVRVVRSTDPAFTEAVLGSLLHWRYEPAQLNGEPVRQIATSTRSISISMSNLPARAPRPRC